MDAQILKYRGIALAACGKHQEAVYCFNHAHDLQPSDAEVLKLRAVTHGEMGLTKQRMEDLNAAVALDIDNADLYRTRGIAHRMVGCSGFSKAWSQACFLFFCISSIAPSLRPHPKGETDGLWALLDLDCLWWSILGLDRKVAQPQWEQEMASSAK